MHARVPPKQRPIDPPTSHLPYTNLSTNVGTNVGTKTSVPQSNRPWVKSRTSLVGRLCIEG